MTNKQYLISVVIVTLVAAMLGGILGYNMMYWIEKGALNSAQTNAIALMAVMAVHTLYLIGVSYVRSKDINASKWWALASIVPYLNLVTIARLGGGYKEGDWWYNH